MQIALVVSGAPGAGKTSLALPLAASLGWPLLSKDVIKERLHDSLPTPSNDALAWSRTLGGAAMDLLWTLAALSPNVVLEANFRPTSDYERERLENLDRRIVEIHCSCPPDLAARRFAERARSPGHHRGAHPLTDLSPELLAEFPGPVGLGEVLVVDTSAPVDQHALLARVSDIIGG